MKKVVILTISIMLICILVLVHNFFSPSNASKKKSAKSTASIDASKSLIPEPKIPGNLDFNPKYPSSTNLDKDSSKKKKTDTQDEKYTKIIPEYGCTQIEYEVFQKMNNARSQAGLSTLTWSDELYRAASIRSAELVNKRSHTRPNGSSCFTVSDAMRSENLAYGYSTSDKVFNSWINSPGHHDNIMNPKNETMAVSLHLTNDGYKYYWINIFGY